MDSGLQILSADCPLLCMFVLFLLTHCTSCVTLPPLMCLVSSEPYSPDVNVSSEVAFTAVTRVLHNLFKCHNMYFICISINILFSLFILTKYCLSSESSCTRTAQQACSTSYSSFGTHRYLSIWTWAKGTTTSHARSDLVYASLKSAWTRAAA